MLNPRRGPETVWALLCVAERRATRANREWGGGIVLAVVCWAPSAQRRCTRQGVVLTDLQSLLDCQQNFSLSLSLSFSFSFLSLALSLFLSLSLSLSHSLARSLGEEGVSLVHNLGLGTRQHREVGAESGIYCYIVPATH